MRVKPVFLGWFVAGLAVGAAAFLPLVYQFGIAVDLTVPLLDIAQLAATIFLALYIPFAVEAHRERNRLMQSVLVDEIDGLFAQVRRINEVAHDCASTATTSNKSLMQIRTGFLSANARLGRLEARLKKHTGKRCGQCIDNFLQSYETYWKALTGGGLYGGTAIDWNLWRNQEFAFVAFENHTKELLMAVNQTN